MKLALDTSVIVSHFRGDEFAKDTREFFDWVRITNQDLVISGIVLAELYTGIELSGDPSAEERKVQKFLGANDIETRLPGTLTVPKAAGRMYAELLFKDGALQGRILPDFLIGAHAESYGQALVTWNPDDFAEYLKIPARTPEEVLRKHKSDSP